VKKSDIAVVIIIVCGFIGLFATPIFLLSSTSEKNVEGMYNISSTGKAVSNIEIRVQSQGGIINILELNEASKNIVEAEWDITHTGIYIPELCVMVSYKLDGDLIKINVFCLVEEIHIKSLTLNVYFNPSYEKYSFLFNTGGGNLVFDSSDINIDQFEFISRSGNLDFKLNNSNIEDDFQLRSDTGDLRVFIDNTNFSKNFICKSYSGEHLFDLWNIRFESVANFEVSNTIGFSNIKWANHYNKSQNVNVHLNSNGIVRMKFWCPLEIMRSDVYASRGSGEFQFIKPTGTFTELSDLHFQTANLDNIALDAYNFTVNTISGDIELFYVNCFKWQRSCNYGNDFFPYNVTRSGNYSISAHHHSVSSINLYNRKYIYLNESRSLTLNYQELQITSEKLLYVDWNIKYLHAMGIGKAPISLDISNSTSDDLLSVFIGVNYELDRILPTFTEYNITVFYHPSYTFNHYLI